MALERHLVQDSESTVRRSESVGGHKLYLTYDPTPEEKTAGSNPETQVIPVKLPRGATNVTLHGPGEFTKRGKDKVYGVRITFTEKTAKQGEAAHSRTIELPHPSANVQLLDRRPNEAYKSVA